MICMIPYQKTLEKISFVDKGHDFKDAVTELFGSNYKTQIKTEMDVSEICAKIDELKEKAVEFIDYNNLTVVWNNSEDSIEVAAPLCECDI